jgi:hypothetical protein
MRFDKAHDSSSSSSSMMVLFGGDESPRLLDVIFQHGIHTTSCVRHDGSMVKKIIVDASSRVFGFWRQFCKTDDDKNVFSMYTY